MSYTLLKKISTKTLLGKKPMPPEAGVTIPLYEVIGVANGKAEGESDNGPWAALTGMFQATRLSDGAKFRAGVLFMPDVALNMVLGALEDDSANAIEQTDNKGRKTRRTKSLSGVEIGFRVSILGEPDAATQYVYTAEPLFAVEDTSSDPLAALLAKRGEGVAQIAAPSEAIDAETGEVTETPKKKKTA